MKCTVNLNFFFFFFWHFQRKRQAFATVYEEMCEKNTFTKKTYLKMHCSHIRQCYLQDVINLFIFNYFRNFLSEFLLFKKTLYDNNPYPTQYVAGVNMMKNKSRCVSILYMGSALQKST